MILSGEVILYFDDLPLGEMFTGSLGVQLADTYLSGTGTDVTFMADTNRTSVPEDDNNDRREGTGSGDVDDYVHADILAVPLELIDLSVEHSFDEDEIIIGNDTSVTIVLTNDGPSTGTNIDVAIPFDFWEVT